MIFAHRNGGFFDGAQLTKIDKCAIIIVLYFLSYYHERGNCMKYHDSKRIDNWSWMESGNNNALKTVNDWMDTSKYGQSIELDDESALCINW